MQRENDPSKMRAGVCQASDADKKYDASPPSPQQNMPEPRHDPRRDRYDRRWNKRFLVWMGDGSFAQATSESQATSMTQITSLHQAKIGMMESCTAPVTRASRSFTYTFTSLRMPNSGR